MNTSRILRVPFAMGIGISLLVVVMSILGKTTFPVAAQAPTPVVPAAYIFDYPLGVPDGTDYFHDDTNGYDVHNPWLNEVPTDTSCFTDTGRYLLISELWHAGTDWFYKVRSEGAGKPVYAVADGVVAVAWRQGWYPGHVLVISHTLPSGDTRCYEPECLEV